jgi:hypothetical protein
MLPQSKLAWALHGLAFEVKVIRPTEATREREDSR